MARAGCSIRTPLGTLWAAATDRGLRRLSFAGVDEVDADGGLEDAPARAVLRACAEQLQAYFAGALQVFDLPLDLVGTPFQLAAWQALRAIPYGCTWSYRQQASMLGRPQAARAVGAANARNPLTIIVPCHRVVGADGALAGYAGGVEIKRALLRLEGVKPWADDLLFDP